MPLSLDEAAGADDGPSMFYDPFDSYCHSERSAQTPHYALARCGQLSPEELDLVADMPYDRRNKQRFFGEHGCSAAQALDFIRQWGSLHEGFVGAQGEVVPPSRAVPLWQFRSHAAYVWGLLHTWAAVRRRMGDHAIEKALRALWWLAGVGDVPPHKGPLPGVLRTDRGTLGVLRGIDTFDGRAGRRNGAPERAVQLLDSLLNIAMTDVRPRTIYGTGPDRQPRLQAGFTTDTLLQAILAMVYLDITGARDASECGLAACGALFRMTPRQRTLQSQGKRVYCTPEHAVRAAARRRREANPEAVRAEDRQRQRKRRAKLASARQA